MTKRTPSEHRAVLDAWRQSAPANDSDILPTSRYSASPRHSAIANELAVLLRWKSLRSVSEVVQTNFLQADNDNRADFEPGDIAPPKRDVECELEIRPTPEELMTALRDVTFTTRQDGRVVPVGGDMERNRPNNPLEPVTRLGNLRFSVVEKVSFDDIYPHGSISHWRPQKRWIRPIERTGTPKGSATARRPPPNPTFDMCDVLLAKDEASVLDAGLSPDDVAALDASLSSQSFKSLGLALGYTGKTAERQGKQRLLSAARNLTALLESAPADSPFLRTGNVHH